MTDVLIIGAGPSGLAAAKACREEGLTPVVVDPRDSLGGLWHDTGYAWPGMRTNLSRHSCSYSDHPWPDDADLFPTQRAMRDYLESYASAFNINRHLRFGVRVVQLRQNASSWEADLQTDTGATTLKAERAIVASGFFSRPYVPPLQTIGRFEGDVIHSTAFRGASRFAGKAVAVVGSAYSGCEIAAELAAAGVTVTHIVRTPQFILTRRVNGRALDLEFYSRKPSTPTSVEEGNRRRARSFESTFGNPGTASRDLHIDPESGNPVYGAVSDDYLSQVSKGHITIVRGEARALTSAGVGIGGTEVPADAVIFATGIGCDLDYLAPSIAEALSLETNDRLQPLITHKGVFHPDLPRFGLVGMYRGPYFAIVELQARWLAASFVDPALRPDDSTMRAGLQEELEIRRRSPQPQFPRGDYVRFADELATHLGVLPVMDASEPLHAELTSGPVVPAHYRLSGRHANRDIAERLTRAANS